MSAESTLTRMRRLRKDRWVVLGQNMDEVWTDNGEFVMFGFTPLIALNIINQKIIEERSGAYD